MNTDIERRCEPALPIGQTSRETGEIACRGLQSASECRLKINPTQS